MLTSHETSLCFPLGNAGSTRPVGMLPQVQASKYDQQADQISKNGTIITKRSNLKERRHNMSHNILLRSNTDNTIRESMDSFTPFQEIDIVISFSGFELNVTTGSTVERIFGLP